MGGERTHFGDDFTRRARILVPAHVGDDAVAAAIVAPDKNGNERLETAVCMRGKRLAHHVLTKLEPWEPPVGEYLWDEPEGARANGEIKLRELLEDISAETLYGAPHKPRQLLCGDEVPRLADGLLLGLLPDGATVDDDKLRVVFANRLFVPCGKKQRFDGFRVADVHLAAVRMDVKLHFPAGTVA